MFLPQLATRVYKCWKPQLFTRELYSEILDHNFSITVTARTLDLIDAAYGFDYYILKVTTTRMSDTPLIMITVLKTA